MRKFASALLIFILLFNWFGYRFVSDYMQKNSDISLEARLDKNLYDESQLIELKIPVHLPYQTSWATFERYDGEIEINGELYKYVKRKVCNDTLYLMCLPNHQKMYLQTVKNELFKNITDLAQNTSKKSDNSKSASCKNLLSEYDNYLLTFKSGLECNISQNEIHVLLVINLLTSPHVSPEQPPDLT